MNTETIVIANQKGGCGKTTTAVQLAAGLALEGYKTCLVDVDGQCNASMALGIDPDEHRRSKAPSVLDIYLNKRAANRIVTEVRPDFFGGNLSLVPGHLAMDAVHPSLEADLKKESLTDGLSPEDEDDRRADHRDRFKRSLESLHGEYDFIIIDTSPSLGFQLSTALRAANWFCIPVFPSMYELNGMQRLIASADKIRKRTNPGLRLLRVLLCHYDTTTKLDEGIAENLRQNFGEYLATSRISRSVRQREAIAQKTGRTIYEHAPGQVTADQYQEFVREIIAAIAEQRGEQVVELQPKPRVSAEPSDAPQAPEVKEALNG